MLREIEARPCLNDYFSGISNVHIEAQMGCTSTILISGDVAFKSTCSAPANFSELWTYAYPIGTLLIEPEIVNVMSLFDATDPDLVGMPNYVEEPECESWKIPPPQITTNNAINESGIIIRYYTANVCHQTANAMQTITIGNASEKILTSI